MVRPRRDREQSVLTRDVGPRRFRDGPQARQQARQSGKCGTGGFRRRNVIIEHDYTPIAGSFFYTTDQVPNWLKRTYCTEPSFLKAARRKAERNPANKIAGAAPILMGREVHYVLKTGANWAGPIRFFRLIIDKKRADDLVSLCWRGLKKVSPTRFVFTTRDFTPKRDLKILFLQDLPRAE